MQDRSSLTSRAAGAIAESSAAVLPSTKADSSVGSTVRPPELRVRRPAPPRPTHIFLLLFGIALPLLTLLIELSTHQCAEAFFDPIPTWWHVALVALVPAANFMAWRAARQQPQQPQRWLAHLNGIAIGVSL